jgi:regulator of replication initiation timing
MENQDDSQEIQNDVPDSDVPELVSRTVEDIWAAAQKEVRKEFEEETKNLKNAVERLRSENARLYKENQKLKEELRQEKERCKELEGRVS